MEGGDKEKQYQLSHSELGQSWVPLVKSAPHCPTLRGRLLPFTAQGWDARLLEQLFQIYFKTSTLKIMGGGYRVFH